MRFAMSLMMRFLVCLTVLPTLVAAAEKPNIIIIMADDLGYGDISPYDGWIETPHLEQMAAEGTRLTDYHSAGNVCSPTRAALMTGRYQQRAGIPGVVFADPKRAEHEHGLQDVEVTIAEEFREGGYATGMFGKWHLGYYPKYNPVRNGFDVFKGYVSGNIDFISHYDQAGNFDWWHQDKPFDEAGYVTHLIDRHSLDFIKQNKDKPFFLYLPHEAPHYPFQRPDDPGLRKEGLGAAADWARQKGVQQEEIRERYQVMVEEMDKNVGHVLALLKELKLDEKTFVFFCSDNGAAGKWGDNSPLRGAKGSNWEGGHRVPAIAWWPGTIPAGQTTDQLAITFDLMPTMLSAAGLEIPTERQLDGMNLLSILTGQRSTVERTLVWNGKAVRQGEWKLMLNGKGGDKVALYNLQEDLSEKTNLADQHPELVEQLKQVAQEWQADIDATMTPQP
ncbi:MAG: sulfatase-like hydrolase/transferase [Planctomycetaceae bacterium]|nr:sulfatase-like hydrolase/transferase [Planctomycetaceae bacterium]